MSKKLQQSQSSLPQRLWRESWTKLFGWVKVAIAGIGLVLHNLANDDHFRDALAKFEEIPKEIWLGLAVIGAITWISAEHKNV